MKINFNTIITGLDGEPLENPEGDMLRLSHFVTTALVQDEKDMSAENKFKRGMLAQELYEADEVNVSTSDIEMIKKAIVPIYGPMIVAKTYSLLDPKED